jgi:hypothetical protein
MNIIPSIKFFWQVIVHKWFVFRAGIKIGVPLYQLLVHDLSKLTPAELPHYARQFHGKADDPRRFNDAWLHHQNVNQHHWEYWIPRTTHYAGTIEPNLPMEMPIQYAMEMAADWLGAARAYEGEWPTNFKTWGWFQTNFYKLELHPRTRRALWHILRHAGVQAGEQPAGKRG